MPILDNEILWRPATLVSDAIPAQNGGRMAFSQLVSGVKNNLFPDVSQAERTVGATKWRKACRCAFKTDHLCALNFDQGLRPPF